MTTFKSGKLIKFPEGFLLGTGSSAYQIEGGWEAADKTPSIWDEYFHTRNIEVVNPFLTKHSTKKIQPNTFHHIGADIFNHHQGQRMSIVNGDIACDSYNKIDEDIKNLVDLGVNLYRFSICWPRVLPTGDDRKPSEAGVKYYKTLIEKLLENNIKPMVTIYHWDLPSSLQVLGGWANPNIVTYFSNFANFLFKTFGDQVKIWSTINEPRLIANGYGAKNLFAPGIGDEYNGIGDYMAIRNILLAHASAYRLYEKTYKAQQQGEVSLCLDTASYIPQDPSLDEHHEAVKRTFDFTLGIYTQPLINGEFPKSVVDRINEVNKRDKINLERIYEFSEKEKKQLIGAYDFIAFNYYNSYIVAPMTDEEYASTPLLQIKDMGVTAVSNEGNLADSFRGFTQVINELVKSFKNPKLFIAENGIFDSPNNVQTEKKINYHRGILTELEKALKNGVNITGYSVWSFMDSLEWTDGYFEKLFGIYEVDFNDKSRPRTKKDSFDFFKNLFEKKSVQALIYE